MSSAVCNRPRPSCTKSWSGMRSSSALHLKDRTIYEAATKDEAMQRTIALIAEQTLMMVAMMLKIVVSMITPSISRRPSRKPQENRLKLTNYRMRRSTCRWSWCELNLALWTQSVTFRTSNSNYSLSEMRIVSYLSRSLARKLVSPNLPMMPQ